MEDLDRGLVAVVQETGVFVSWRWLGQESSSTGFYLYRDGVRLNSSPITDRTNYVDSGGSSGSVYTVSAVVDGVEQAASAAVSPWTDVYKYIPLNRPAGGTTPDGVAYTYSPNDASVADLDGDGQYEIVLKWDPSNSKDNAHSGYTGNVFIDAYELDGTQLWRIDLGRNVRAGAHYTQFIAYDFDSDGYAEVALRTADGTVDGVGNVIGSSSADYRNASGYVLSGPEYLTVFDGPSGQALATTDYVPERGTVSSWGDSYGNRVDRFLAGLAFLDGERPSIVMTRGYYTRAVVVAWDYRDGALTSRWVFDSLASGNGAYAGQGAHSLAVADVDADGRQEIIFGAATIDDDGTGLYSTGLGHGDALHVSDMDPSRAGLEVYMVHETPAVYGNYGSEMHAAESGSILWGASGESADVGRGVAMDIDPDYPGYEAWATRGGLRSASGVLISSTRPSQVNFGVYWDGDLLRELLDDTAIYKWDYAGLTTSTLLQSANYGAASNNGTKATPALSGDILGDWREEVLWRSSSDDALLLFTTTIETSTRLRTLMHDPQYRAAIAWQNVAYNQPPHPSFFLGADMAEPAAPDIQPVGAEDIPGSATLQAEASGSAVQLSWQVSHADYNAVQLYRDTDVDPSGRTRIAVLAASTTSYTDSTVEAGTTYFYWGKVVENDGNTINSAAAAAVVPADSQATLELQEASTGFCVVDGAVESEHTGYTGSGYSNTTNTAGTGVTYAVGAPLAGYYAVQVVFANGGTSSRPGQLHVNGVAGPTLDLASTGAWTSWETSAVATVYLEPGTNALRLQATANAGLPNVDLVRLSGDSPYAASCSN